MIRQTPMRRVKVLVAAAMGAGMLATAALAATSTAPRGSYGGLPVRGGYGGYGGYGQGEPDQEKPEKKDKPEKDKKPKKDRESKQSHR